MGILKNIVWGREQRIQVDGNSSKRLSSASWLESRDGILLEEVGRQCGNLVLRNGATKHLLHFVDDGRPFFFGMLRLHINVIG